MISTLSGATRLNVIVGDPVAQVRAPAGVTKAFAEQGHDGILVPVQVSAADLPDFISVATRLENLDGIIVTIPHKFACYQACESATDRAHFLGAANLMRRRRTDRKWHGDMVDGLGFLGAARANGINPQGKRGLLVGAGGTGSAIALALIDADIDELAIHDSDAERRDILVARLTSLGKGRVRAGTSDPDGYDLVANATPAGMTHGDALPIEVSRLAPSTYCGCVITKPEVSPFIEAARKVGCISATGTDMYKAQQNILVDFLLSRDCEG